MVASISSARPSMPAALDGPAGESCDAAISRAGWVADLEYDSRNDAQVIDEKSHCLSIDNLHIVSRKTP
jgi:hypothetical protein